LDGIEAKSSGQKPRYLTAQRASAKPSRFAGALLAGIADLSSPVRVKKEKRSSAETSSGKPDRRALSASVNKRTGIFVHPPSATARIA
jgi:hypothetical protein